MTLLPLSSLFTGVVTFFTLPCLVLTFHTKTSCPSLFTHSHCLCCIFLFKSNLVSHKPYTILNMSRHTQPVRVPPLDLESLSDTDLHIELPVKTIDCSAFLCVSVGTSFTPHTTFLLPSFLKSPNPQTTSLSSSLVSLWSHSHCSVFTRYRMDGFLDTKVPPTQS